MPYFTYSVPPRTVKLEKGLSVNTPLGSGLTLKFGSESLLESSTPTPTTPSVLGKKYPDQKPVAPVHLAGQSLRLALWARRSGD